MRERERWERELTTELVLAFIGRLRFFVLWDLRRGIWVWGWGLRPRLQRSSVVRDSWDPHYSTDVDGSDATGGLNYSITKLFFFNLIRMFKFSNCYSEFEFDITSYAFILSDFKTGFQ